MIILLQKTKSSRYYSIKELITISILVTLVILCIFYVGLIFVSGFAKIMGYDSLTYIKMSYAPFHSTLAPYMYRIFTPVLAYVIPFDHIINFALINLTALFSTAVLFYYYLKKLNFNQIHSFIGVLLFLLSPTIIFSMYDIVLVDFLSFFFFLLAFYAMLCKNSKMYIIALILGVLNKETILFTLPLYFLFKLDDNNLLESLKSTILIAIIPLALFFGIRYYFGFTSYFSLVTIKETLLYVIQTNSILINPYLAFGTLGIVSLYNIKFTKNSFLKKSLYILPFIFAQIFIATDIFRALFIAFPIVIPLSLYLFKIKNVTVLIAFIGISFFMIFTYILLTPPNGQLISLIVLPLEILISTILLTHYLSIKSPLKRSNIDNTV